MVGHLEQILGQQPKCCTFTSAGVAFSGCPTNFEVNFTNRAAVGAAFLVQNMRDHCYCSIIGLLLDMLYGRDGRL